MKALISYNLVLFHFSINKKQLYKDLYVFREANQTRVVSYLQSELGGMLPQSLVDNALPSNIQDFYSSLKKALKQDGHLTNGVENGQA